MAISVENISLDTGQKKINGDSNGELQNQLKLDKIKRNENYNISRDTGEHKTEEQSVWRITTSVLIMDKIKLNNNQYGELLFKFCLRKIKMNDKVTLDKIEMSGNQYGGFAPSTVWLITI